MNEIEGNEQLESVMNPLKLACAEGPSLTLRLIRPEDAAYVYSLRTNPTYNFYLSRVAGTVEDQYQWIEDYKIREAQGQEFYYVIERKDGERCGLVRLYDIAQDSFTWGSWILDANKPRKAALESAVLALGLGFHALDKSKVFCNVRVGNVHTERFHHRFGMVETHRTAQDIYFVHLRTRFNADYEKYLNILKRAALEG